MDERSEEIRREYRGRINRVMDFIEQNLSESMSLETLSSVANFSKYHLHRIFYTETGETLFHFIQRLRLERAALLLRARKRMTITDIALDIGFSCPAAFARAFKNAYGISATAWRYGENSNTGKTESNCCKDLYGMPEYSTHNSEGMRGGIVSLGTEVRSMGPFTVAYIRHTGKYQGDAALFERLYKRFYRWAGPRGLLEASDRREIVVYHDSPGLTDDGKLRISAGLTVPPGTEVSGEIGSMIIPAGKYVVSRFRPLPTEYGEAWYWVFGTWMPESGLQPGDGPSFEMYDPLDTPDADGCCTADICVAVQPL